METNLRQLQHPSRASSSCKSHVEDMRSPGQEGALLIPVLWTTAGLKVSYSFSGANFEV